MATSLLNLSNHAYETSGKLHRKADRAAKRGAKHSVYSHGHSDEYEDEKMHRGDAHDYHRIALHLDKGRHGHARRIFRHMDTAARDYAPPALARHLYGVNEEVANDILSEGFHQTAFADTAAAVLIRSHANNQRKMKHSNALHDLADHIDSGAYKMASKAHAKIDPDVLHGIPHVVKQHLKRVGVTESFVAEGIFDAKAVAKELLKRHGKNVTSKHVEDFRAEMDEPHKMDKNEVLHHLATMRHDD